MKNTSLLIVFICFFSCKTTVNEHKRILKNDKIPTKISQNPSFSEDSLHSLFMSDFGFGFNGNGILDKSMQDILNILRVSLQKKTPTTKKILTYPYFDFSKFKPRHDTTAWHTDFVKVAYDLNGNIVKIFSHGDAEDKFYPNIASNDNYHIYEYDSQYRVIVYNPERLGGYLLEKWKSGKPIPDDLAEQLQFKRTNWLYFIQDKKNKITIYIRTSNDIFKDDFYRDFNAIGILYPNFLVKHKWECRYAGQGVIGLVTDYLMYLDYEGFNIPVAGWSERFKRENREKHRLYFNKFMKINDLIKLSIFWMNERKNNISKMEKEIKDFTNSYNYHHPDY